MWHFCMDFLETYLLHEFRRTEDLRITPSYHTCCWHFGEIHKKEKKKNINMRFGIKDHERQQSRGSPPKDGQLCTWDLKTRFPFTYSRSSLVVLVFIAMGTRWTLWRLKARCVVTRQGHVWTARSLHWLPNAGGTVYRVSLGDSPGIPRDEAVYPPSTTVSSIGEGGPG